MILHSIKEVDWKEHKKSCQSFDKEDNLLIVSPSYGVPMIATIVHTLGGSRGPAPSAMFKANVRDGRNMVLKIQAPSDGNRSMFVCNKKQSFECLLEYNRNPVAYERIKKMVNEKGIGGMRAFFAAELRSKDELAINIAECLPEARF